jgi:hypothetical protein
MTTYYLSYCYRVNNVFITDTTFSAGFFPLKSATWNETAVKEAREAIVKAVPYPAESVYDVTVLFFRKVKSS